MLRGDDADAATARIAEDGVDEGTAEVLLRQVDQFVHAGEANPQGVVKIDVEGHDLEVLMGMRSLLADRRLKPILIEMHFAILLASDRPDVPWRVEKLLHSAGFSLDWVDQSHLHASRA
ncbi:FkbM family methyltransferase [Roseomonas sp. GCM10028921]